MDGEDKSLLFVVYSLDFYEYKNINDKDFATINNKPKTCLTFALQKAS